MAGDSILNYVAATSELYDGALTAPPDGEAAGDAPKTASKQASTTEPASSASIPHESLTTATVGAQWSASMPWLALATATALLGGTAWSLGVLWLAVSCAAAAGFSGAKIILGRRRRVRLQGDRLVQDTLLGTTEVRLKDIHTIKAAGGRLSTTTPHPLSADRLAFVGDVGAISFSDLEPEAATAVANAVLQAVGPRLLDEFTELLARGRSVPFGPHLLATRDGLVDGRGSGAGTLRWSEIERVDTTPAGVRIFAVDRPDQTITIPTWTENAVLLDALVRRQQSEPPRARGVVEVPGWEREHVVGGPLVCGVEKSSPLPWAIFGLALLGALGTALFLEADAVAAVAAVVTFFGSLTAATAVVMQRKRAFAVYERGVADSGGFVAFDDVVQLKRAIVDQYANGGYVGRSVTLVLTGSSGQRVRLSGSGDRIEGVAAAALRRALPLLVDRARALIKDGGSLKAGSFVVDAAGLRKKKLRVPWAEIESAVVESGCLHIWRRGVDRSVLALPLDQPDALVVIELIGERMDAHRRARVVEPGFRDLFGVAEVVPAEADVVSRR